MNNIDNNVNMKNKCNRLHCKSNINLNSKERRNNKKKQKS